MVNLTDSNHSCLAIITTDSALKKDDNYYLQTFLKECKYIKKEKKTVRFIADDPKSFSRDSDKE